MIKAGRMYQIIRQLIVSEKSSRLNQFAQCYCFVVAKDASKVEIKQAVESIFSVDVLAVRTVSVKGKLKRFRGRLGRKANSKKAYVTIAEGQVIEIGNA